MSFNENLNSNYSSRGSSQGSGGSGRGGSGGVNPLFAMLLGTIGRRFGIPGVIIVSGIFFFASGGLGNLTGDPSSSVYGSQEQQAQVSSQGNFDHCQTYEDANRYDDCNILATAVSLDSVWEDKLPAEAGVAYRAPDLVVAEGQVSTGCGRANISQTGPFYCPGDETVYMSVPFFDRLKEMGGSDGNFAMMYVTAHEFAHHLQHTMGTLKYSDYNDPGADSGAVQVEVQADCYAGVWAAHADKGENALLDPLSEEQIQQAIDTARAIGDDAIQRSAGQEVNPDAWTHGSSEQRVSWFTKGYEQGTLEACAQPFNS
ncbi:neutral zinc metallopeptidase [Rothia sp. ZJ932]|uniref:KPN_02809 family neutral zinc metallopeptidase n=1 Tax=Rothia sp. ZJ932 TaxID=2810516 RepID=UPI0019682DCE|nr:neutral zinc metallopeptidase [Rothia sp. ZJ932]QRZ61037.1 neutral zinc metallopeptidase [Rothia sp. ZJ932]